MQSQKTKIIIISAVVLGVIVIAYGIWAGFIKKENRPETAEEKMNKEILTSLRVASDEPELSEKEKAEVLFSLRTGTPTNSPKAKTVK